VTAAADPSNQLYRHPSDVARLVFALTALALLVLVAVVRDDELSGVSIDILALVDGMPRALVNGLVGLVQLLAFLTPITVLIVLVRARMWQLMLLMALAATIAGVTLVLLSEAVNSSVPVEELGFERVDSWFIGSQFPSSTYLGMLTALLVTASPWLTTSWRRTGWVFIVFVMFARVLSSVEVPVRNLMLLAVGAAAGSLALVIFGAPRRRVDVSSVSAALARAGIGAVDVDPRPGQTRVPSFTVRSPGGSRLFVKVIGRDQRDSDLLLRTWRSLTLKGLGGGVPASPRGAVEHEALAMSLLGSVASTPAPVGVLGTDDEAAMLVSTYAEGDRLSDIDDVNDEVLDVLWSAVAGLQERRLAHGALDASNVMVDGDRVTLVDLARADIRATDEALGADVAELLASLALLVGADRAVDRAAANVPTDVLGRAVPLIQRAVLTAPTRRRYKDDQQLLDTLRDRAASAAGIDSVELAPVRRITVGGIVSLVGSLVLMAYVFNLAANWDQTWEAFTSADLVWAIPVILMMISTYFSGAMSLMGSVTIDLVFFRTVAVMFGQSYLNRFTPANAGGMAMRVRYLQLNGLDTAVSASAIALTSAASGAAQVVTIAVFLIWGGSSDKLSDFEFPDIGTIVVVILAVGLVASLVLITRFGKTVIRPWITSAFSKIRASIGDLLRRPGKLAQLFGGALLGKLANVIAFWASMQAFGVDISFPKAGAMYIIATTIGSAVPTPGGVGGVEAALTAALIAYGVDNATAAAIVLFFRTLTFWLPTIPGYGFFRYTQAKGIV
jgi:uncharacterized protein (TIRG00374 family)